MLVSNHVGYIDAAIIGACCPRPVRFVMDHRIFANKMWGFIFRHLRAIPIAPAKEAVASAPFAALRSRRAPSAAPMLEEHVQALGEGA